MFLVANVVMYFEYLSEKRVEIPHVCIIQIVYMYSYFLSYLHYLKTKLNGPKFEWCLKFIPFNNWTAFQNLKTWLSPVLESHCSHLSGSKRSTVKSNNIKFDLDKVHDGRPGVEAQERDQGQVHHWESQAQKSSKSGPMEKSNPHRMGIREQGSGDK